MVHINRKRGVKKKGGRLSKQAGEIAHILPLSIAQAVVCNPPSCILRVLELSRS